MNPDTDHSLDLVWGAEEIGAIINRTTEQTRRMLASGSIKCAQRKGKLYCASRAALIQEFSIPSATAVSA